MPVVADPRACTMPTAPRSIVRQGRSSSSGTKQALVIENTR
jgi:hypothetical protein